VVQYKIYEPWSKNVSNLIKDDEHEISKIKIYKQNNSVIKYFKVKVFMGVIFEEYPMLCTVYRFDNSSYSFLLGGMFKGSWDRLVQ
jgi:hypothetical protein